MGAHAWRDSSLRRECPKTTIIPLSLSIFFAVVLVLGLQCFSNDADTLGDLLIDHLQKRPARVDPKTTLLCVRCTVWRVLYAGDACIVLGPSRGLELMIKFLVGGLT